ncbi:MAG: hypothetical protein H0U03_11265 [Actinobacteria bacterium]|nr:hypothetical protein [Actinomycetota bacterium]
MATLRELATRATAGPHSPAVVVDVGWVNGLAALRSLGRAGLSVVALDHRHSPLGFRSRYALPLACPEPSVDDEALGELLRDLGDLLGRPAPIFATHDDGLNAIARHRGQLGDRFRYPFPDWDVLSRLQSKRYQLERAVAAGMDIPRSVYPSSAGEAHAATKDLGLPVVVKPSDPVEFKRLHRRQGFRCDTAAELDSAYAATEPFSPIVQELVPGGDDALYTLGSYLDAGGRALGIFSGRKLRQTPPGIGTCRVGEAVWVDEVVDAGLRLLRAVGCVGVSQVEFKRDQRDGCFKLMEINARLWQWHGLAAACGVDFPLIAYRDLLGIAQEPVSTSGVDKRWAITFLAGETPAVPRPPFVDAVFAHDDLEPVLAHAARVVKGLLRR